jgi:predicted DNA-binding protein with PD1-like motif
MHYKLVDKKPKTFVLVFETNDELAGILHAFASEQKLASASFKAIGALSSGEARMAQLGNETIRAVRFSG